jgi:hypothetical protein
MSVSASHRDESFARKPNFPDEWQYFGGSEHVSSVAMLGNGPSLKEVNLRDLDGIATIGMNAAYRHWERIDWYPTYYCCLDEVVVESHADAIAGLLDEGRVQRAFLSGRFFEVKPEYVNDPRILDLDRVSDAWFRHRGEATGKSFLPHAAFTSCYPSLITTGSWATRWAAFLGYRYAFMFGVDLEYVEKVDGAVLGAEGHLRMTVTPDHNPNYFIDDYQQVGDEFQVPNPILERPRMHVEAFAAIIHDFDQQKVGCELFSAQPESGLARTRLFPAKVPEALGRNTP